MLRKEAWLHLVQSITKNRAPWIPLLLYFDNTCRLLFVFVCTFKNVWNYKGSVVTITYFQETTKGHLHSTLPFPRHYKMSFYLDLNACILRLPLSLPSFLVCRKKLLQEQKFMTKLNLEFSMYVLMLCDCTCLGKDLESYRTETFVYDLPPFHCFRKMLCFALFTGKLHQNLHGFTI